MRVVSLYERASLNRSVLTSVGLLLALGGCAVDASGPADGPGGKADDARCLGAAEDTQGTCRFENGRFAPSACCEAPPTASGPEDLDCSVVWVNGRINDHLFEEGFGSAYDHDADEDSVEVSVKYDGGTPVYLSIGQMSFSADDGEFTFADETSEDWPGELEGQFVTTFDGDFRFEVRQFAKNQIAALMYDDGNGALHYGTLDCRENRVIKWELEYAEVLTPAEESHQCWTVDVNLDINDHLFEEGFGSIFDIDSSFGDTNTDGDSREVSVRYVDGEADRVSLGQFGFSTDDGNTLTTEDTREEGSSGWEGSLRTQIETPEGEAFEVEEFPTGLGRVGYRPEGEDTFRWYATLDCRSEMTDPGDL